MKVRCITTDPEQFPIEPQQVKFFWVAPGMSLATNTFDSVEVRQTYIVYAIKVYAGYPFYFVSYRDRTDDWMFVPSLCFEVLDSRVSKLWHFGVHFASRKHGAHALIPTAGIKEWVDEPRFFERLVDCKERECRIMKEAVAVMNAEHEL